MTLTLYSLPASPPCRTVLMVAKLLDIELDVKNVDLFGGEQRTPEYLKVSLSHAYV